jgi:hypothetical protein
MIRIQYTLLSLFLLMYSSLLAQNEWLKAPARSEGEGPFSQLIIRGVTLINGTGSPPIGPVDVVVEQNRITQIAIVGAPGVEIKTSRRPKANPGAKIMEAEGMYLLPGFVDMHGHMGGKGKGATPEYIFKLWMGHGQTTILEPQLVWNGALSTKGRVIKMKLLLHEYSLIQPLEGGVNLQFPRPKELGNGYGRMQRRGLTESSSLA